jgi:hypothetical protein
MKVISIWNPWATLIVRKHKSIETRSWKAPKSLIGQRIGIASTKAIRPDQRLEVARPEFAKYYLETGLPVLVSGFADLSKFDNGYLLGTVLLHSCDLITEEDMDDITEEEQSFGWFSPGRYAWRLREPVALKSPIQVRGSQGIWEWPEDEEIQDREINQEGSPKVWGNLRLVQ